MSRDFERKFRAKKAAGLSGYAKAKRIDSRRVEMAEIHIALRRVERYVSPSSRVGRKKNPMETSVNNRRVTIRSIRAQGRMSRNIAKRFLSGP